MAIGVHFLIFLAIVFIILWFRANYRWNYGSLPQALLLAWHDFNFNSR
jgi:hypothetical protein